MVASSPRRLIAAARRSQLTSSVHQRVATTDRAIERRMSPQNLVSRVDRLEHRVENLESLPGQVAHLESQFLQFRDEVRGEFSAVARTQIRSGDEGLRAEMKTLGEALRAETRAGDEETQRLMRILHEDVISRLAILQEQNGASAAENGTSHRRPKKRVRL